MALRISAFAVLLFSVLFLPFWLSVILALSAMAYFPKYWEAPALFFVSDALFGASEEKFFGMVLVSFFASVLALAAIEALKKKLKFYS